jgi:acyl-coenzyme A thioesterase PaaI-like protein
MDLQREYEEHRRRTHPHCATCSPSNERGLGLEFTVDAEGGVSAEFTGGPDRESYPGVLHGGIISMLFDCAMVQCFFVRREQAVTAELTVRFHSPVQAALPVQVSARITKDLHPLYYLEGVLTQAGVMRAKASAKFMVV